LNAEASGDISGPRQASRGRTFVYVLPCQGEDLLKVGFTRDPLQRFHVLHKRFFTFFDLEAGFLIETDRLRDARRLERLFIERWPEHNAPAPLVVPKSAAGHTEWFRGIKAEAAPFAQRLSDRYGHTLHQPLRAWLAARFMEQSDVLYGWSAQVLAGIEDAKNYGVKADDLRHYGDALNDLFAACRALDLDASSMLPPQVVAWTDDPAHWP
jgi:T5orf172 domain.